MMNKDFFTVKEAMERLGISRALAYKLITEGTIPTVRLGRRVLVPGWYFEKLYQEPAKGGA